jgi:hypothetical protein
MAKFLHGNELNTEIGKIFENASEILVLVSPFIKLHHRYADSLKSKVDNDKLSIRIVFGKNEGDITKSLSLNDFAFFKQFPDLEIRYEKRLHAKFYANESTQILTSMNLYDYSQDQNIEAGIKTEYSILGNIASKLVSNDGYLDKDAWDYFKRVFEHSEVFYRNVPQYESILLGLTKKYIGFKTEVDKISEYFTDQRFQKAINEPLLGYCIRYGDKIPFNPQRPYSEKAYKSWAIYKNPNYKEKFCHKTGQPSNGLTSMAKPILSA